MAVDKTCKITLIVENDSKRYIRSRAYGDEFNNGCNHIDNISCTANEMGKEIREQMNQSPSELLLDKTVTNVSEALIQSINNEEARRDPKSISTENIDRSEF